VRAGWVVTTTSGACSSTSRRSRRLASALRTRSPARGSSGTWVMRAYIASYDQGAMRICTR
jgi:hypothetical protein